MLLENDHFAHVCEKDEVRQQKEKCKMQKMGPRGIEPRYCELQSHALPLS